MFVSGRYHLTGNIVQKFGTPESDIVAEKKCKGKKNGTAFTYR